MAGAGEGARLRLARMPVRTARRPALQVASLVAALAVLATVPPAHAAPRGVQGPAAEWRTVTTEHFRVHYPAASEAWARHAAARLEAVRERVAAEVGFTSDTVVDVVVSDPVARPNGYAYPVLGWPRLVLWTSPPGPDSVIGHYRDWPELLLVHEAAHLAHLLRPPRDPLRRALGRVLPVGPIAFAPRWVVEGYATLIEGRLTGSGRPNGDLRAAVLRRRALAGKLPSYGALAGDESWLGRSMAYLAGSAFLEWLEERAGEGSLRDLWARMTARTRRDFDEAFRGVFADSPEDLYGRFAAELTWRAVEAERRLDQESGGPGFRDGEPWLDLAWQTGAPAVSPDGGRLALVVRGRDEPDELVVWSTAVDEEAVERARRRREEAARRDPEDVPAVDHEPPPRERLAALPTIGGAAPAEPRWMPDGESLLLVRWLPDAEGFLHPDLHRWWPGTGRLARLTAGADLRQPDPAPDGTWAAAIESRHGLSRLVRVELGEGGAGSRARVEGITEAALDTVYDGPRVSPDGTELAFARHSAGRWELVVRELASGEEASLPLPAGATVASPAWGRGAGEGQLYAVVGAGGFIDVHAFARDRSAAGGWRAERRTRTRGAAFAPEPSADGEALFFLSLEPDGLDLRRLALGPGPEDADRRAAGTAGPAGPPDFADLAPAVRPPAPAAPPPPEAAELPPSRGFGLGRQELALLGGGSEAPSSRSTELGVRSGDLLGRLDLVATASLGDRALVEGGAVAAAWRGPSPLAPWTLAAHAAAGRERPSRQPVAAPGLGRRLDLRREGLEVSTAWERLAGPGPAGLSLGGYLGRVDPLGGAAGGRELDERSLFAEAAWRPEWSRGEWRAGLGLAGRADAGDADGDSWSRHRGELGLSAGHDDTRLALAWAAGGSDGVRVPWQLFQVGGVGSSVLPSSALAPRVLVPALPAGTLVGERFEAQRAELTLGVLPLPLFYARYRAGDEGDPISPWIALAGAEWRGRIGPLPLLRLPAVDYALGAAEVLDPPFDGEREWWLSLTWRP